MIISWAWLSVHLIQRLNMIKRWSIFDHHRLFPLLHNYFLLVFLDLDHNPNTILRFVRRVALLVMLPVFFCFTILQKILGWSDIVVLIELLRLSRSWHFVVVCFLVLLLEIKIIWSFERIRSNLVRKYSELQVNLLLLRCLDKWIWLP